MFYLPITRNNKHRTQSAFKTLPCSSYLNIHDVHTLESKVSVEGLTLSPIQQSRRKILNVHSAERNGTFFKLESFENIVAEEEIPPIGAFSSFVTMFSNVVCRSRRKNEYLWNKGLKK